MPLFKVVSGFCAASRGDVYPGDVLELNGADAVRELYLGRVVSYVAAAEVGTALPTSARGGDGDSLMNDGKNRRKEK